MQSGHITLESVLQEYKRAAHVLQQEAGSKPFFLRMYSLYLAGEKRREWVPTSQHAAGPVSILI